MAAMSRKARRGRTAAVCLVCTIGAGALAPGAGADARPGVGSDTFGDPYTPGAGNGGYDVEHYDLSVEVFPDRDRIEGRARIELEATQTLSRFNLDLYGLTVRSVSVDGRSASFSRTPTELVITPPRPLRKGDDVKVEVRYDGKPDLIDFAGFPNGWFDAADGATVVGEPPGASTWFPVNDHPADKATYEFAITVPAGLTAVANGLPAKPETRRGRTTWRWSARDPMASYLVLLSVGNYELRRSRTPGGLPIIDAVDPAVASLVAEPLSRQGEIIEWAQGYFGRYPFEAAGALVDDLAVGFALENQTRPFYSSDSFLGEEGDEFVVVHELAHQWYGDSLGLRRWQDIWLNEGFATYAEWLWSEDVYDFGPDAIAGLIDHDFPPEHPLWQVTVGDPGPDLLFSDAVYLRGALTLRALRAEVGDDAFFRILRTWAQRNRNGLVTTPEFIALAERVSGRRLGDLFRTWLFTPGRPESAASPTAALASTAAARSAAPAVAEPPAAVARMLRDQLAGRR